ncbi:hypothetical protein SAMN05660991_01844 [Trujillonella endophytica]|uniref:Uncharacterized protein n=1 Tax=Trujillonella endophytica TaxID=673521 RepID=A0A1H8SM05_9ACTN|nr:hypothetical protein SAMN05660991_01844 [Trujillella endophytica]
MIRQPAAVLAEGNLVPRGLTREAIERAGSVPEVVSSGGEGSIR